MPLSLGQVLHNRYRIVKLIGQGGFGAVYRAWDTALNQPCAVKENLDTSPEAQRQFQREATLLAGLRHPNLPRVIDHFLIPGQGQYLVMDYVEGRSLDEILDQKGQPLTERETLPWLEQVCDALEYLHNQNPPVIHRDLKPQNIIITPANRAMLVDFGISKVYDPQLQTTTGAQAVTPGFSPPEQYGQGRTDSRSDVYALGATLYTALTGQSPPDAIDRLVHGVPLLPPRQVNPHVSATIERAILKATDVDTKRRFQSIRELRAALARPASTTSQLIWPWLPGGIGLVVIVVVVSVMIVPRVFRPEQLTATPVVGVLPTAPTQASIVPMPTQTPTGTDTLLPTDTPVPEPTNTLTPEPTNTSVSPTQTPTSTAAPYKPYEGVEVNLLTFEGPQIIEPLQRRAPDFEVLTGAKVSIVGAPGGDLYQKGLADLATGTNSFDAFVFAPRWLAEYVALGYLEDLTNRVAADEALTWDDIVPFFREFSATYGGRIYAIPLDGDVLMAFYRKDLLAQEGLEPPTTWNDYLNIAATFHGKDLNGDGNPDYGSCITKKRGVQVYWLAYSVASAFLQSQGTSQGVFFDTETMEPLVNNEAFAAALGILKETAKYGPPDELNLNAGDTRNLFTAGRCALSVDLGDAGMQAMDSVVRNKVGAIILPGSTRVLDRASGKLVDCDMTTCPYAVNGVNHAPYAAWGGWYGAINAAADPIVKDAAYAFLSYMSQPAQANVDVTIGETGFNPYRISQFQNDQLWIEAGMSQTDISSYLGAIEESLQNPNVVVGLYIPQNQRYQLSVLDTAISQYLAGEITMEECMQHIYAGWEKITEELARVSQLNAYRKSLGITR